jgi:hypothetical protein
MENLAEAQHSVRTFNLKSLGAGSAKGEGASGRKQRFALLDRIARLGSGLSAAQRNDWLWFREQWDAKMLEQHGENWALTLAGWMQHVLTELDAGTTNSFSLFVRSETQRCFSHEGALTVP